MQGSEDSSGTPIHGYERVWHQPFYRRVRGFEQVVGTWDSRPSAAVQACGINGQELRNFKTPQARATESLALACESRVLGLRAAPTPAPMNHPGQSPSICSCSWPVHCISAAVARRKASQEVLLCLRRFSEPLCQEQEEHRTVSVRCGACQPATLRRCAKGSGWPLHALRLVTDWLSSNHAWRFPFPNGYSQPASVLTCGSGSAFSLFPGPNFF